MPPLDAHSALRFSSTRSNSRSPRSDRLTGYNRMAPTRSISITITSVPPQSLSGTETSGEVVSDSERDARAHFDTERRVTGQASSPNGSDASRIEWIILGNNRSCILQIKCGQLQTTVVRNIPHHNLPSPSLSPSTYISPTHVTSKRKTTHPAFAAGLVYVIRFQTKGVVPYSSIQS